MLLACVGDAVEPKTESTPPVVLPSKTILPPSQPAPLSDNSKTARFSGGIYQPQVHPGCQSPPPSLGTSPRFVLVGDTGTGKSAQQAVARALLRECSPEKPFCDAIFLLGDNLYPAGKDSRNDHDWQEGFVEPYRGLKTPILAILGNHDHRLPGSPESEVGWSAIDPRWIMPSAAYQACPTPGVEIYALDTAPLIEGGEEGANWFQRQTEWLKERACASTAPVKLAMGHHPALTFGAYRRTSQPEKMRETLEPTLTACGIDLYLSGHDHNLQVVEGTPALEGAPRLRQVVSGAGGGTRPSCPEPSDAAVSPSGCEPPCLERGDCPSSPGGPRSLFSARGPGYSLLTVLPDTLRLDMVEVDVLSGAETRRRTVSLPRLHPSGNLTHGAPAPR